jgi:mannose-6-phosphate isomerase-like protein (cupin superfamily)
MRRVGWVRLLCLFMLCRGGAQAQSTSSAASAVRDPAVTISHTDIEQALRAAPKTGIKDAAIRVVPVRDEYNVGVFAVRRTPVNGRAVPDAYAHHDITEVYQVVSGGGTLVTGGTLESATEFRPDDPSVVNLMGPTAQGVAIKGGTSQHIGPGDVVVIPANTPHGFAELAPEGISYVVVRIDPHHVLKAR